MTTKKRTKQSRAKIRETARRREAEEMNRPERFGWCGRSDKKQRREPAMGLRVFYRAKLKKFEYVR